MKPLLILYASSEGQTRVIAEHVGEYLAARGLDARAEDVEDWTELIEPARFHAVVLVASVHLGCHAREMVGFVKKHRRELEQLPTAFLSVSLAAASAEDSQQNSARHPRTRAEVERATKDFLGRACFSPTSILAVAGSLLYNEQGRLVRFLMQPVAEHAGLGGETARNFEYAAWARLDRFIDDFARIRQSVSAQHALHA